MRCPTSRRRRSPENAADSLGVTLGEYYPDYVETPTIGSMPLTYNLVAGLRDGRVVRVGSPRVPGVNPRDRLIDPIATAFED